MEQQNKPQAQNNSKIMLIIIGVLVILLIIITAFSFWSRTNIKLEENIDESINHKTYQNDLFQISYRSTWIYEDCSYNLDSVCLCPDHVDDCSFMSGGGAMPNTAIILKWTNHDMRGGVSDDFETFYTFENERGEIRATATLHHDEYKEEFIEIIESFRFN